MRFCAWCFLGVVAMGVVSGCTQAPPWVEGDEAPGAVVFAGQLAEGSAFMGEGVASGPEAAVAAGPRATAVPVASAAVGGGARRAGAAGLPFQTPY